LLSTACAGKARDAIDVFLQVKAYSCCCFISLEGITLILFQLEENIGRETFQKLLCKKSLVQAVLNKKE